MRQLAINTVNALPAQCHETAKQERFVNVLVRQYLTENVNVFRALLEDYEHILKDMLDGDELPNPVDVEFIRRAARHDYALGREGRAIYQHVYDYVQALSS